MSLVPTEASVVVNVLLPLRLNRLFGYRLGSGTAKDNVPLGSYVRVPFRNRIYVGVVWQEVEAEAQIRYKTIEKIYDYPPMPQALREYLTYLAGYYVVPLGLALKLAFSGVSFESFKPRLRKRYRLDESMQGSLHDRFPKATAQQMRVLELLLDYPSLPLQDLCRLAGVSEGVVYNLTKKGALVSEMHSEDNPAPSLAEKSAPIQASPSLSAAQKLVADELCRASFESGFGVYCLNGVTGSGKSEVYFHLIEKALQSGRNVLVLLPEIALTRQWQRQFLHRFSESPLMWHSGLSRSLRSRTWRSVVMGEVRFLVGARSCLSLPLENLGLVVVDEEHDPSYKQEDSVGYHARDMAVVRAQKADCPILLVSATLSLETYAHVENGKYRAFHLPQRIGLGGFADVRIVDLRDESLPSWKWISAPLQDALEQAYRGGKQSLLYVNRRGYAPLTLCRHCGYRLECPHCEAWLVEHRRRGVWLCHHCDYRVEVRESCPHCETVGHMSVCGVGVERLCEEVQTLFPKARLAEMTSDSMASAEAVEDFIGRMWAGEIDIVVGTQLIAKGYHFPQLTVVGVVDADMGLGGGDLRAAERSFQLLQQVSGRSGRGGDKGQVFLQTTQPDNAVIRAIASAETEEFYQAELQARKRFGLPPLGRLVAIIVSGSDESEVHAAAKTIVSQARKFANASQTYKELKILGPTPAPLAFLRDRYRYRLLVQCPLQTPVQSFVNRCRQHIPEFSKNAKIDVKIDIDPLNFY